MLCFLTIRSKSKSFQSPYIYCTLSIGTALSSACIFVSHFTIAPCEAGVNVLREVKPFDPACIKHFQRTEGVRLRMQIQIFLMTSPMTSIIPPCCLFLHSSSHLPSMHFVSRIELSTLCSLLSTSFPSGRG